MGKLMRFVVPCLLMALVVACSGTVEEKIASDLRASYESALSFISAYKKEKGY